MFVENRYELVEHERGKRGKRGDQREGGRGRTSLAL
jgi:hypothetical protein